ncbi:uncharacterized protein BJX67DRAFT_344455 [Aspergillus lucknowensis]|uniref:Uncharacterized protein n=1 Tax=Aspergillus lucknowensis TaxID=176173 RepID=A0ABR4M1R3_9EURO
MPLLHCNWPCCASTMTAFNSIETSDNSNTRLLYEPLEEVERLRTTTNPGAITLYRLEVTFTVDIELFISWDMAPIQLHGWPVMNNPINLLQ